MDLIDKHRTFLFLADVAHEGEGFPAVCGRARDGRMEVDGIGIGPGEGRIILTGFDQAPLDEPSEEPGVRIVGRSTVNIWTGKAGDFYRFDALTYPDLRDFRMITWKGQNFGAFATEWERWNSPILVHNSKLTPLVDNCGLLVGYFQQGVSTDLLFATPDGEIFYALNYGSYMSSADRIGGKDLWLSDTGQISTGSAAPQLHRRVPGGNKADIIVDIDGFVLAINMYLDPPLWQPQSPFTALVGFLIPDAPKFISKDCLPGGAREGTEECLLEYEEMMLSALDWTFFVFDIITLGTSAIARKIALKLLRLGTRVRKAAKALKAGDKARQLLLKGGRAADNASSLVIDVPQLNPKLPRPPGRPTSRSKRLIKAETSGKKANLSPISQATGMTNMAIRDVRYKMIKNGVRVRFRPAGTARKLRKRGAVPKWEELKMKTINDDDIALGAPKSGKSQPGYFEPKMPDPSIKQSDPARYERLMKRHKQRQEEYRELAEKVEKYKKEGDITVENGVVKDGATGKDIAGDYDIYEILDKTGKRITDADPRYNKIVDDLRGRRIGAQHGAHVEWKPKDPFEKKIYDEIVERHRTKEPLYEFREDGSIWETFAD